MNTTLTIRNLEEPVKQALRMQAASHGRSMEAEAREILSRGVMGMNLSASTVSKANPAKPKPREAGKFDHMIGIWKGRGTTDQLMQATRGED